MVRQLCDGTLNHGPNVLFALGALLCCGTPMIFASRYASIEVPNTKRVIKSSSLNKYL